MLECFRQIRQNTAQSVVVVVHQSAIVEIDGPHVGALLFAAGSKRLLQHVQNDAQKRQGDGRLRWGAVETGGLVVRLRKKKS